MTNRPVGTEGALAAMYRARIRAEEIAAATGTALVQMIDGKMVLTYPQRRDAAANEAHEDDGAPLVRARDAEDR